MKQGTKAIPFGIWAILIIFSTILVIELVELTRTMLSSDPQPQFTAAGLGLTALKLLATALFVYSLYSLRKSALFWLGLMASTVPIFAILDTLRGGQVPVILLLNYLVLFVIYLLVWVYLYMFKRNGVLS